MQGMGPGSLLGLLTLHLTAAVLSDCQHEV
jgi:hypothetical protein